MVFDKERAKREFADWLNRRLDAVGVQPGRGRAPAVAKRYKVSIPAARKWLEAVGLPDMAQLAVIVHDLGTVGDDSQNTAIGGTARYLGRHSVQEPVSVSYSDTPPGYVRFPLLVMEAGMGAGTEMTEPPEVVDYLDIAEWWADVNLPRPHNRVKIITGRGDSNAPLINHGDIVFVDTAANSFDGEGLYVFNWNGRALIKRLVLNMRGQGLRIISANPAYPPEDITMGEVDQLYIAGRVIAWYSLRRN